MGIFPGTRVVRVALASLVLLATGGAAPAASTLAYVAMGDSFTSGEGLAPYDAQTSWWIQPNVQNGCHRSAAAYPRLVASAHDIVPAQHVACNGAAIENLLTKSQFNEPPQIAWLSPATDIVSVMIGLNDVPLSILVGMCGKTPAPYASCRDYFRRTGEDFFSVRIQTVEAKLRNALSVVKSKAPFARVLVLDYPHIFPEGVGECEGFSADNAAYVREKFAELNEAVALAAAAESVRLVSTTDAFAGHERCTAEPYITGVHPNAGGHAVLAGLVQSAL